MDGDTSDHQTLADADTVAVNDAGNNEAGGTN